MGEYGGIHCSTKPNHHPWGGKFQDMFTVKGNTTDVWIDVDYQVCLFKRD